MKKYFWTCAIILMLAACDSNNEGDDPIVGKWYILSVRHEMTDHTAGTYDDRTIFSTNSNYIGYDTIDFDADGNSRWHMNDRYVSDGMFTDPYRYFNWYRTGDSLIVWKEFIENRMFAFEIKELSNSTLVVEEYYDKPEEYSHHHIEGTDCYTLKRVQ